MECRTGGQETGMVSLLIRLFWDTGPTRLDCLRTVFVLHPSFHCRQTRVGLTCSPRSAARHPRVLIFASRFPAQVSRIVRSNRARKVGWGVDLKSNKLESASGERPLLPTLASLVFFYAVLSFVVWVGLQSCSPGRSSESHPHNTLTAVP